MSLLWYTSEAEASVFKGVKVFQAKITTAPSRTAPAASPAVELQWLADARLAVNTYMLGWHWCSRLADVVIDSLL
jgi:hypothetical protein